MQKKESESLTIKLLEEIYDWEDIYFASTCAFVKDYSLKWK